MTESHRPPNAPNRVTLTGTWLVATTFALLSIGCSEGGFVSPSTDSSALSTATARAARSGGPASCVSSDRLIGRIALTTEDTPGTWWHLTRTGMDAAGLTDYVGTIEGWFGQEFSSQADAVAYLVAQVMPVDVNGNGFVCAYGLRGTRTNIGDPLYAYTLFNTRDDKHTTDE